MDDESVKMLQFYRKEANKRPHIFLSGGITAQTQEDLKSINKLASDIAYQCWCKGWSVISPHKNCYGYVPNDLMDYQSWMIGTLSQILRCDALLLLPDWEKSKGARIEHEVARYCKIPIYEYKNDIPEPKLRMI